MSPPRLWAPCCAKSSANGLAVCRGCRRTWYHRLTSNARLEVEYVISPAGHIEIQPTLREVGAGAIVGDATHVIAEAPLTAGELGPRQRYVALACVRREVYGNEPA